MGLLPLWAKVLFVVCFVGWLLVPALFFYAVSKAASDTVKELKERGLIE